MMTLHWFRTEHKSIGRGTLGLALLLWFAVAVAPCVMAQTQSPDHTPSHCPKNQGLGSSVMIDCGPVTAINCQLPDVAASMNAAIGDFTVTPVLLNMLPVSIRLPSPEHYAEHGIYAPDISAPPLHIRYLTLLI